MSNNKQLILDFWTNISWKELKGRLHFRVYGDRPVFVLNLDNVPYMIFNNGEMYQVVGDKEEPFTPRVKDDAGNRFTTQDIVQDCLERSARNETGDFEIEYACDVIQTYINAFKETVANDSLFRPIPYFIIFNDRLLKLQYATDRFLYYDDMLEMPVMFRTIDGSLVSNNEFADIGLLQSMDAVQEEEEKPLEIRQYPDVTMEEFVSKHFPDAIRAADHQADTSAPDEEDDMDFPW